jgi:hypothetical protein
MADIIPPPVLVRALRGEERSWKIWWVWGIPAGWTVSALTVGAEFARSGGNAGTGDAFDALRLLLYFIWFRPAWRCAHNVTNRLWEPLSRLALAAGWLFVVFV